VFSAATDDIIEKMKSLTVRRARSGARTRIRLI
jgi:hypothetical protein